jgi:hypothetical protein
MRICIEGPSAVGKSTLCRALSERNGWLLRDEIVIEPLAGLTPEETAIYYLEREVERWNSTGVEVNRRTLILDTDPMKPLWFNWSQDYRDCMPLEELEAFYRGKVECGEIGFADCYIVLDANAHQLRERKESDPFRARDNFEWISSANEHRRLYYRQLHAMLADRVIFIEAEERETTLKRVEDSLRHLQSSGLNHLEAFDGMIAWLRTGVHPQV